MLHHSHLRPAARRASAPRRGLPPAGPADLTTARFAYSRLQLDLLVYLVSTLDEVSVSQPLELSLRALSRATDRAHLYRHVAAVAEALVIQPLTIRGDREQDEPLQLFESIHARPEQRTLDIQLAAAGIPYLLKLRELICPASLPAFFRLTSRYTKRIYLLCRHYRAKNRTPLFAVVDFRQLLGLIDAQGHERQQSFATLRQHILDPAVAQINATTDLQIAYQLENRGQKTSYLAFTVRAQALPKSITGRESGCAVSALIGSIPPGSPNEKSPRVLKRPRGGQQPGIG